MEQQKFLTAYPFKNGTTAKNRIVLSPMTNGQSHENGALGPDEFNWLVRCARGGFGIVTTCAAYITATTKAWSGQLGIHDDAFIPELKHLTQTLKAEKILGIMQIFHGGVRASSAMTGQQPVSASEYELSFPGFEKPRALSIPEIHAIIQDFANAAERAWRAGFHGVELHGANGYLITQFLSTETNLRTDEYGGSITNRARFVREITQACRKRLPAECLLSIRLSPEGIGLDLDETLQVAEWLVEDGIDYLDLSLGNIFAPSQKYPNDKRCVPEFFKERLQGQIPLMAAGSIQTPEHATHAMDMGLDFVALARGAIGNPTWPSHASDPHFAPRLPPFAEQELAETEISPAFLNYLKGLPKGFALK